MLYGPSGAGKSSLMQAGVIPVLQEKHDFLFVGVDGWPASEAPLEWLVQALYQQLDVGLVPMDKPLIEQLDEAIARAVRRSDRPVLIYLDQLEQLLLSGRDDTAFEAFLVDIDCLSRAPLQHLQIVLALREDYLGPFRDRLRDRKQLLTYGFRVGPLSVLEMTKSVCRAAKDGKPSQIWDEEQLRSLIIDVRVSGQRAADEAEVQSAYAQIVCRALFADRATHGEHKDVCPGTSRQTRVIPIASRVDARPGRIWHWVRMGIASTAHSTTSVADGQCARTHDAPAAVRGRIDAA